MTHNETQQMKQRLLEAWDEVEDYQYKLFPNFLGDTNKGEDDDKDEDDDVTLVLHLDLSKWTRLLFSLGQWTRDGPSSIALLLNSADDLEQFAELLQRDYHRRKVPHKAQFHLMLEKFTQDNTYPYNILRELALQHISTTFFILLDVDFMIPSMDTYGQLRHVVQTNSHVRHALLFNQTFLVIPAFDETSPTPIEDDDLSLLLPANLTKSDLLRLVSKNILKPFHINRLDDYSGGYGPTNYTKWVNHYNDTTTTNTTTTTTTEKPFYEIDYGLLFEPYILGAIRSSSANLPHFWPHFRGIGLDKASWFLEAHACPTAATTSGAGYQFAVLYDFFILHIRHAKQFYDQTHNVQEFRHFKDYLVKHYDGRCNSQYIHIRPPYQYLWWTLFPKEREAMLQVGFDETLWNTNQVPDSLLMLPLEPPNSTTTTTRRRRRRPWNALNQSDQELLSVVKYTEESWNAPSQDPTTKVDPKNEAWS